MGLFGKKDEKRGGAKNAMAAWKERMNAASEAGKIVKDLAAGESAPAGEGNDLVKRCETLLVRIDHMIRTIYGGEGTDAENIAAGDTMIEELNVLIEEMRAYTERYGGGSKRS